MASSAKRPWAAPLREFRLAISSRGADKTSWIVTWRTAEKGDEKDLTATLAEGEWPKGIQTKEDAIRAAGSVMAQLWDTFIKAE